MSVVLLALPFALLVLAAIIAAIVVLRRRGALTLRRARGGLRRLRSIVGASFRRLRAVGRAGRQWLAHLIRRILRLPPPRKRVEAGSGVRRMPGPVGPAPLPVVLVHGFFGFDRIGVPGVRLHYFRGIVQHLEAQGCHAHAVRLPPVASVPERAKMLVDAIAALPHDRVDIIAHSLGGLDARYALAHLGLASKVRSLVTVGTPHRGTPIADLAITGAIGVARKAIGAVGIRLQALDWLSPAALARFNEQVKDVPGVRYACVVAGIRERGTPISLALVPAHAYLRRIGGPNDGLVPIASQYWGEVLAEIEADHWEQVGWRTTMRGTFDALAMYAWVVARLGDAQAMKAAS